MGKDIIKKTMVDGDTGEVLREYAFFSYDGFNDKGYKYRYRANKIQYFFDTVPTDLSKDAFLLLIMLAEIANEDNMLVYKLKRKSKFSNILYKPMQRDEMIKAVRYKLGENKFDQCFRELKKHCIKKIKYHEYLTWAINPAYICKCKQVPPWLFEEFRSYLTPYMSKTAIRKMEALLAE